MNFHDARISYAYAKEILKRRGHVLKMDEYYRSILSMVRANKMMSNPADTHQPLIEAQWIRDHKPYYNVYPGIIRCLTKLRLTIDSGMIKVPMPVVCVRLPVAGNPFKFEACGEKFEVRTIFLAQLGTKHVDWKPGANIPDITMDEVRGVSVWMDVGEHDVVDGVAAPVITFRNFSSTPGVSVEKVLEDLPLCDSYIKGIEVPRWLLDDCIRLCCTLCLLENDPSIIEPDVLADDREKFLASRDNRYVEKALKRNKIGWNVGRQVEMSPHYRGPSPAALYWTGPGRTIPKIRFRAGTIVHREVVKKLPQGYEGVQ